MGHTIPTDVFVIPERSREFLEVPAAVFPTNASAADAALIVLPNRTAITPEYATTTNDAFIAQLLADIGQKTTGLPWTAHPNARMDGGDFATNWPTEDHMEPVREYLRKRDIPPERLSTQALIPMTQFCSKQALKLLQSGHNHQDIAVGCHRVALNHLAATSDAHDQADLVFADFGPDKWPLPDSLLFGTAAIDEQISVAMLKTTPSVVHSGALMHCADDERYVHQPTSFLVDPASRTVWIIDSRGSKQHPSLAYVIVPLQRLQTEQESDDDDLEPDDESAQGGNEHPDTTTGPNDSGGSHSQHEPDTPDASKVSSDTRAETADVVDLTGDVAPTASSQRRPSDKPRRSVRLKTIPIADDSCIDVDWTKLNEEGYVVLEGAALKCLKENTLRGLHSIFPEVHKLSNGPDDGRDDGGRWQEDFPEDCKDFGLNDTRDKLTTLLTNLFPGLKLSKMLVLGARARCRTQRPAHTDSDIGKFNAKDTLVPLSIMIAVQKETHLVVYPASHTWIRSGGPQLSEGKLITLRKGSIIVWRGDLVHQGAPYKTPNTRLFFEAYLPDHKEEVNTTDDGTSGVVYRNHPVKVNEPLSPKAAGDEEEESSAGSGERGEGADSID